MKKQKSAKSLAIWGVVWLILFFPVGIILLIAAYKRRKVELAAAVEPEAPKPQLSDEELKAILNYTSQKHGVATAAPARSHGDYDYRNVDVCILRGTDPDLSGVSEGDEAELVLEPENDYDPQAVAVYIGGERVGYLYKGGLKKMVYDFLTRGDIVGAEVSAVGGDWVKLDLSLSK